MRFAALDALRGVCALVVIIYHFEVLGDIYAGSLHGVSFVENGFLFVDFFFVLSGFVLTYAYFSKITTGNEAGVFVIRRFGRVYPLHLLFLILFIGLEFAKLYASSKGLHGNHPPFTGAYSIPAIFTNIFLIQALNVHSMGTWNTPSWSISVEFFTYLLFALCAVFLNRRKKIFLVVCLCISAFGGIMVYIYSKQYMFTTYDYAIFRCFYGFFCGAITYLVTAKIRHRVAAPAWVFLIVEAMTLVACFAFVSDAGASPRSMLAPEVFAIAVAVFSFEKGRISALLTKWPFQLLGDISYTLYISHAFILDIMKGLFRTLQQKTAYISVVHYGSEGNPVELLRPASEWASNAVDVGILMLILVLSAVVNRWVEIPCRDYFGRVAKRFQRPRATAPSGGAGLGAADSDPAAARAG